MIAGAVVASGVALLALTTAFTTIKNNRKPRRKTEENNAKQIAFGLTSEYSKLNIAHATKGIVL
jgi:hypothetical protein